MTIEDLHLHQVAQQGGGRPSEDELALRFTLEHGTSLRFVAPWLRWLVYQEGKWCFENTLEVMDHARTICRQAAEACTNGAAGREVRSAKTVAAVERLARADRRHAARVEIWDADPLALLTPEGVVDLRTGNIRPARPEDYCTKQTSVAPKGHCPTWFQFLERITNGNTELQEYLKRLIGYGLTGSIREHILAFLYGTGANGKSVLLNTVSGIAGDYHRTAPMEIFMTSHSDRHPTELAMLRGARMVTSIETEEGRQWAESRIKALTGGDPVAARFMRQDFFEFTPQFKLLIAGNHKPQIRNVDEAMRRRLHLIPFAVTIPEEERDEDLPKKLRVEWPGILEWMIEGAVEWGMTGLRPPETVRSATDDYLSAEDSLTNWIEEDCNVGNDHESTPSRLFARWCGWCNRTGEKPGTQKRFSQNLIAKGFERDRQGGTGARMFKGICEKSLESENHDYNR